MGIGLGGILSYEAWREKKVVNNINRLEYDDLELRTDHTITGRP